MSSLHSLNHIPANADVEKIRMNDGNYVDFIQQYVKKVRSFSSQYGGNYSVSYTAINIIGPPFVFPRYGDFSCTFAMRTYGPWWDKAPSRSIDYMPQNNTDVVSQDYIDIEFLDAVYPIRVSIFETYNPGSVIRIWAQNLKNQWFLLWNGPPQIVPSTTRIFSPPLRPCDFKTKILRLEFKPQFIELLHRARCCDAYCISCKYPCHEDIHNLTPDKDVQWDLMLLKMTLYEHCIMCKRDIVANFHESKLVRKLGLLYYHIPPFKEGCNSMQYFLSKELSKFIKKDEFKKPSHCSFSALPDEIIVKILRNLDLKSLCCVSRVNKRFNNLAKDPLLYTSLNLKPYWYIINTKALYYLIPKCKYLRRLDLSWCDQFSVSDFALFLDTCGNLLTHLRLNCCLHIDDFAMLIISRICRNLKELGLRNCDLIKDNGFSYLENLECLECLDLYRTHIKTQTLCKILRRNKRMRHLHIGGTDRNLNIDEVAIELRNSCPDLESIDLWKMPTLTSQGINALADCKKLREVDFGWCGSTMAVNDHGDSFRRLLSSCQYLEKIILTSFRGLTERDLRSLTLCKNLKQLDLLGVLSLTSEICYAFFENCPKLEMIDLSICDNITDSLIQQWQQKYTHVAIKRIKCQRFDLIT